MLKLFPIFLPIIYLTGCSEHKNVNLQEELKKDTSAKAQLIIFSDPIEIDSSHTIIYPLILEKGSFGNSYFSSSGGQRTSFWNLIFYNTETQTQNLLTSDKKILIYAIDYGQSSSSYSSDNLGTNGINIFKDNIIYTVVAKDFNLNKMLDQDDPSYLFISDRDGSNFKQISPDDYNINSWKVIKGTSKIIMQAQRDDNGDKTFNEKDGDIPLIVDIKLGKTAVETFKPDFIDSVKQRLVKIWKN